MMFGRRIRKSASGLLAAALLSGVFFVGLIDSCDNRLVTLTTFFDPCGTILDCTPGTFQGQAAGIGNPCFDPTCTVPGGCDNADPPLGLNFDLCP